MISDELKKHCAELLNVNDYQRIAEELGISYGYVKDIKNRFRYNKNVETLLKEAIRNKISQLKEIDI